MFEVVSVFQDFGTSALWERARRRYGAAILPAVFAAIPNKMVLMSVMTTSPPREIAWLLESLKDSADLLRKLAWGERGAISGGN